MKCVYHGPWSRAMLQAMVAYQPVTRYVIYTIIFFPCNNPSKDFFLPATMIESKGRFHPTRRQSIDAWPPVTISSNETAAERSIRVEAEARAKKVSEEIDHAIDLERSERRRRKPDTKILLLGECSYPCSDPFPYFIVPRSSRVR